MGKCTHQEITYWKTEIAEAIAKQCSVSSGTFSAGIKSLIVPLVLTILFLTCQFSGDWTSVPTEQCYLKWQLNSIRSGQIFCYHGSKQMGNTSEHGLMELSSAQEHLFWFFFKINCIVSSSIFPQRWVKLWGEELVLVMMLVWIRVPLGSLSRKYVPELGNFSLLDVMPVSQTKYSGPQASPDKQIMSIDGGKGNA